MFVAGVDFDGDVDEFFVDSEGGAVFVSRAGMMRDHADDGGEFSGADLPDVQVGYFGVAVRFDYFADDHREIRAFGNAIQQNRTRIAQQRPRPGENHNRSDQAHRGVKPNPAEEISGGQGDYRSQGCERIRQDVDVGGFQIQIVRMPVAVTVAMVMMIIFQHEGTEEIHEQAHDCDNNCIAKMNGLRRDQAMNGIDGNNESDDRQHDGAGESAQDSDFTRAESEASISGVAAAVGVSGGGENEGGDVRAHVPAIGDERH